MLDQLKKNENIVDDNGQYLLDFLDETDEQPTNKVDIVIEVDDGDNS